MHFLFLSDFFLPWQSWLSNSNIVVVCNFGTCMWMWLCNISQYQKLKNLILWILSVLQMYIKKILICLLLYSFYLNLLGKSGFVTGLNDKTQRKKMIFDLQIKDPINCFTCVTSAEFLLQCAYSFKYSYSILIIFKKIY